MNQPAPPEAREELLDELVASIEEKRALGQYNHEQLKVRLCQVLDLETDTAARSAWLTQPLVRAILDDDFSTIRTRPPSSSPKPPRRLLFWLCQWKLLQRAYGWKGADDFVLMALRFGAPVEEEEGNLLLGHAVQKSNLACAVEHGTVHTLHHLARAQKQRAQEWIHRETVLQDIWRRALDRACPRILRVLLRYIPATERVWIEEEEEQDSEEEEEQQQQQHVTAVEYLLHQLVEYESDQSADDLGQCLLLLLEQGVAFSPLALTLLSRILFEEQAHTDAHKVAQMVFGNWLPPSVRETQKYQQRQLALSSTTAGKPPVCVICLEDPKPPSRFSFHHNPMTTLYCGHSFCIACIRKWGASDPEVLRATKTLELSCPICRKPLPREFLSDENRNLMGRLGDRRRNTLGLDRPPLAGPRGPQWLSRSQIVLECQARGIPVEPSYEEAKKTLAQQWKEVRRQRNNGPTIMVDLGASKTVSPHYVAPNHGPVVIPIRVRAASGTHAIPLLAGISGSSPYTVVSPEAADRLGLKIRGLGSNEFQKFQPDSKKSKHKGSSSSEENDSDEEDQFTLKTVVTRMKIIDELVITLGDSNIDVKLRNAIVPAPGDPAFAAWRPGIVLGLDFLESAAWTQTAVEVDVAGSLSNSSEELDEVRFMILLHGGLYIHRISDPEIASTIEEEFRFYAFNGRSFRTPLLHVQPDKSQEVFFSVGHARASETMSNGRRRPAFSECEWCCRMFHFFPSSRNKRKGDDTAGMVRCGFCRDLSWHVFYCDQECQKRAHEAHNFRHGEYYGIVASWCPVLGKLILKLLMGHGHVFVVSFLIGFAVSLLWPQTVGKRHVQEIMRDAQRALLSPGVE